MTLRPTSLSIKGIEKAIPVTDNLDVLKSFSPDMAFKDWDSKIKYRGVACKQPEQLDQAKKFYETQIPVLKKQLDKLVKYPPTEDQIKQANLVIAELRVDTDNLKEQLKTAENKRIINFAIAENYREIRANQDTVNYQKNVDNLTQKIERLKDKYASVVMEQGFREAKLVDRVLHHTLYYIDLTAGDDGDDGLSTGNAWLTLEQYTTTTVRSAGDIAYVRANTSEIPTSYIICDESGTLGSPISIIGCDATTNDPWSDASNVKPIIDFNDAEETGLYLEYINYWSLNRLDVKQAIDKGLEINSDSIQVNNCVFHECAGTGLKLYGTGIINSCEFYSNQGINVEINGHCIISNSIFNGGADTTETGILNTGYLELYNNTFGLTTEHGASLQTTGIIYGVNNNFGDSVLYWETSSGIIYSEDHNQVKGSQYSASYEGTVESDASPQLDSLNSILMTPSANVTSLGLTISHGYHHDYAIWCPASETTITIKARETSAWSSDPTNTQFYFETSYLNHATNATRSTVKSIDALSGTTEISFDMTFTPAQAGFAYVTCFLKAYEEGKSVNVSVKPSVT